LARTCQNGCYDAFCRPSPLYVQPGQESGKPFHPGERQKLILFQLRHRVSHYIDLQFTAVRRHTVSRKQVGQVIIITTSWGSANSISGQKVQSRYTPVGPRTRWLELPNFLRLASPSFLNLSLCVHIVLFVLRTRRRSAVASLPTRSNRPFIRFPFMFMCLPTENYCTLSRALAPSIPASLHRSSSASLCHPSSWFACHFFSFFHFLANYGILDTLPILHVGKAQSRGTVWKTSAQKIPDLSHRFRRVSTFLIDQSPQFHGPKIRFNHVLQLKKQPFNSGARTYRPAGPALVLVWLNKSSHNTQAAFKQFKPASSARRLPRHLTSA
jgi:hypothetical protein